MLKKNKHKIKANVVLIDVNHIEANPNQPRKFFAEEQLDSLAKSISRNGLLMPIIVVQNENDKYTLVAGERRLKACKKLGMAEIPCIVEEIADNDRAVLALVENMHRENLNYFEEAEGINALINTLGISQSKVCAILDISQPSASNKIRLLRLNNEVKKIALENNFPERVARALLKIDDEDKQIEVANVIAQRSYNTARAEEYIDSIATDDIPKICRRILSHDYRVIFSSVDEIVKDIKNTGVNLVTQKSESEEYYLYTIKVHKQA